jgi:thioesterase domain-containing protein
MCRHLRESLRGFLKSARTSVLKVAASGLIASARYRPGFYPGELTLFTPVEREPGLPSLQATWRKHACTLSIVEIAGAHSTMFSAANAESTAASLTRCLPVCAERTLPSVAASLDHS